MARGGPPRPDPTWLSASEVGDYAYCPRSYWYRHHPPAGGPSEASRLRSIAGDRFHATYLAAAQTRGRRQGTWRAVVLAAIVVAFACLVGAFVL